MSTDISEFPRTRVELSQLEVACIQSLDAAERHLHLNQEGQNRLAKRVEELRQFKLAIVGLKTSAARANLGRRIREDEVPAYFFLRHSSRVVVREFIDSTTPVVKEHEVVALATLPTYACPLCGSAHPKVERGAYEGNYIDGYGWTRTFMLLCPKEETVVVLEKQNLGK